MRKLNPSSSSFSIPPPRTTGTITESKLAASALAVVSDKVATDPTSVLLLDSDGCGGFRISDLLRKHLYRQATQFASSGQGSSYDLFLGLSHPTDPMATCTPVDVIRRRGIDSVKTKPPRARWSGMVALFFVLICEGIRSGIVLGPAASSTNNLRFAFYVMCAMIWCIMAIPVMQFQHALSQFLQGGPLRTFSLIHPRLRGIGFAIVCLVFLHSSLQIRIVGESILYVIGSSVRQLPWVVTNEMERKCRALTGSREDCAEVSYCVDIHNNGTCIAGTLSQAQVYYDNHILGPQSPSVEFHREVAIACFVAVFLIFIASLSGIRLLGQVAAFTVSATLLILGMLTMSSLNSPGGAEGASLLLEGINISSFFSMDSWVSAALLVARQSTIVGGHHCLMVSYTRVGKNVLPIAWFVGFFSLIASCWSVAVVYAFQGSAAAVDIHSTLSLIHQGASSTTEHIKQFIAYELEKELASASFKSRVMGSLLDKPAQEFLFILYPWGISQSPGGPMLGVAFYFCLSIIGGIAVAVSCLVIVCAIREIGAFERSNRVLVTGIVLVIMYCSTVPSFFNGPRYSDGTTRGLIGRTLSMSAALSTFRIGVPFVGLCQIFGVICVMGHRNQSETLFNHAGTIHIICLGLGTGATILLATCGQPQLKYYGTMPVAFITFICIPFGLAFLGKGRFKDNLYTLLVGDVAQLRNLINGVMAGNSKCFRLHKLWGICLKYGTLAWVVTLLLSCGLFNVHWDLPNWGLEGKQKVPLTADLSILAIAIVPIVLFALFPKLGKVFDPTPCNKWKLSSLPKKCGPPQRLLRRRPVKFWEEFFSPETIWSSLNQTVTRRVL